MLAPNGISDELCADHQITLAHPAAICASHVVGGLLAEGHLHRSLGHSPRKQRRQETFWPKAIFSVSHSPG